MYCKYCNVEVKSERSICPLCHNHLAGEPQTTPVYPPRKNRKYKMPLTFKRIYFTCAIAVLIVAIALNLTLITKCAWSIIVAIGLLYVYFTISNTILYKGAGGSKIFIQTIMMSISAVVVQYVMGGSEWAYEIALPAITIAGLCFYILFISIFNKKYIQYLRQMIYTSIIGAIPEILYRCNVFDWPVLAHCSIVMSMIVIIGLILLCGKPLLDELTKKGHF